MPAEIDQVQRRLVQLELAARQLAEEGVGRINLGLLDTETTPGLARFKLGAGATPLKTGGTWIGW